MWVFTHLDKHARIKSVEAAASLDDLSDVTIAGAAQGDILAHTGAGFENVNIDEQEVVLRLTGEDVKGGTPAEVRTLINVEDGADVTDATNVDAAGAVMESDFDAQTILAATLDDTPAALTIAEGEIVGRASGGDVDGLNAAQVKAILALDAGDITYTPTTAADWDGDADPGDADDALDQLAERVDDLEAGGGGGGAQGDGYDSVSNSSAETTIGSTEIAANAMGAYGVCHVRVGLQITAVSWTTDVVVRIKFGGTTVMTNTLDIANDNPGMVMIDAFITNVGSDSSQEVIATVQYSRTGIVYRYGSASIDTSSPVTLSVTTSNGTADAAYITELMGLVVNVVEATS